MKILTNSFITYLLGYYFMIISKAWMPNILKCPIRLQCMATKACVFDKSLCGETGGTSRVEASVWEVLVRVSANTPGMPTLLCSTQKHTIQEIGSKFRKLNRFHS